MIMDLIYTTLFYDLENKEITLDLVISKDEHFIIINSIDGGIDMLKNIIVNEVGIKLDLISLPLRLVRSEGSVLLPFINSNGRYKGSLIDNIYNYCELNNLSIVYNDSKLIKQLLIYYNVLLSRFEMCNYINLENMITSIKELYFLYNYLTKYYLLNEKRYMDKFMYEESISFNYCGHKFNSIDDYFSGRYNNEGYLYKDNYYLKVEDSENKYYPRENSDSLYLRYYIDEKNYGIYLKRRLKELNVSLLNIEELIDNLDKSGLYFRFILFLSSNNLDWRGNDEGIYMDIIDRVVEIKEAKFRVSLNRITYNQLYTLINFLLSYPIFVNDYLVYLSGELKFTLHYYKKNLESNFIKYLIIYFNVLSLINKKDSIIKNITGRIKNQVYYLINEIESILLGNKISFLDNERFYCDPNYRLLIKYFFFDNNLELRYEVRLLLEKYNISRKSIRELFIRIQKYHFYRNYFINKSWMEIVNNYSFINFMENDDSILLYNNRLNKIIFNNLNFKSIPLLLTNKFYNISFLDTIEKIERFLYYNKKDLKLIFIKNRELNNYEIKLLSRMLYYLKLIENMDIKDKKFKSFINSTQKIKDIILDNNYFNIKVKEMGYNNNLNLGIITKHIINFSKDDEIEDPLKLVKKYHYMYLHYRKKYYKYKCKYLLLKLK